MEDSPPKRPLQGRSYLAPLPIRHRRERITEKLTSEDATMAPAAQYVCTDPPEEEFSYPFRSGVMQLTGRSVTSLDSCDRSSVDVLLLRIFTKFAGVGVDDTHLTVQ